MQRFFIPQEDFYDDYIISHDKGLIKQLKKVLRVKEGDKFWLFDGSGLEYLGQLIELSINQVKFLIIDRRKGLAEIDSQIVLYQALIKADKFEWILQKATELGVAAIVPVICTRSIVRQVTSIKMKRYQEILKEATEQCGGVIIPELSLPVTFLEAIKHTIKQPGIKMIAWEKEDKTELIKAKNASIFIGPEGGFTEEEINLAKENNVMPISLGKRILRSETAAIISLAKLL